MFRQLLSQMRDAKRRIGTSLLTQAIEIWRLRASRHSTVASEHHDSGLLDDRSMSRKQQNVGSRAEGPAHQIQDPQWLAVGNDKLLTYVLLDGLGLPYPRVKAVCHATRFHPQAEMLRTPAAIEAHL